MIRFLLDTDIISHAVRGSGRCREHLERTDRAALAISAVTLMEIEYGLSLNPARRPKVEASLGLWLPQIQVLEFRDSDAPVTASIRVSLRAQGLPIGPYDLLNAGLALSRDLTLVTHNTREYARVGGLRLADWVDDPLESP